MIWAVAILRPSKSIRDLEIKSVKKKYKSLNFDAGCSREVIEKGAAMLGRSLDELIEKNNPRYALLRNTSDRSNGEDITGITIIILWCKSIVIEDLWGDCNVTDDLYG